MVKLILPTPRKQGDLFTALALGVDVSKAVAGETITAPAKLSRTSISTGWSYVPGSFTVKADDYIQPAAIPPYVIAPSVATRAGVAFSDETLRMLSDEAPARALWTTLKNRWPEDVGDLTQMDVWDKYPVVWGDETRRFWVASFFGENIPLGELMAQQGAAGGRGDFVPGTTSAPMHFAAAPVPPPVHPESLNEIPARLLGDDEEIYSPLFGDPQVVLKATSGTGLVPRSVIDPLVRSLGYELK